MKKDVIVLMPAYEPDDKFIKFLKKLNKEDVKVIVVNDGSSKECDKYFLSAKKYAIVLTHSVNMGKGAALKTGYKYIRENYNNYIVVTVDCDGQHNIKDTLNIVSYALEHNNELVLGSRKRDIKIPLRSKIGNSVTRFVYRLFTGLDVYDTQTGLRAFSNELIDFMIEINGDRFEYEMNVLLMCSIKGIKIKEIEIDTIYIDNNSGSHFNPIKDSINIYKEIIKFGINKKKL